MTDDLAIKRAVLRLADQATPRYGMEARVVAAVVADSLHGSRRIRLGNPAALVASFVLTAFVIGVLLGARIGPGRTSPSGRNTDPAAMQYSSVVDRDVSVLDHDYATRFSCKTRAACDEGLLQLRVDSYTLLLDLSSSSAPRELQPSSTRLRAAIQQFIGQLNTAIATVEQPDSDYIQASTVPNLDQVDLAAAGVICWPFKPLSNGHGFSCS